MSYSSNSDDERSLTHSKVLKNALFERISEVHSAGSFATFGTIENFVHPGISVDSVGTVRLPLSEDDAQALVQTSRQAPFGKGTETLVDVSVRKTWEIDATKVQFLNKGWQCCLDRIVGKVTRELGVAGESRNVRAEFYKMLLYEEGAMFKAHKDTEKVSGMFGTLVVCLPSKHTGGTVCLQHGTKKESFDTSEFSAFDATCIAWYADVTHEIKPVQSGHRWVLTYNLINDSKDQGQSASILDARIRDFAQSLKQWQGLGNGFQYLVWPLEYKYTNQGLRLAHLKGDDYNRVRHVSQSCREDGEFYVFLANMEMHVNDPNHEEEERETASQLYLTHLVDLGGFSLSVHQSLVIDETALLEETFDSDRDPDTQLGGEFMGNQHAEIDQFYNDSIMILVPKCSITSFLLGKDASQHDLKGLIARLKERMEMQNDDPTSQELLVQICQSALSAKYKGDEHKDLHLGPVAVTAVFMQDASLFTKTIEQTARGFDEDSYSALGELICLQDLVVSEDDIIEALKKSGKLHEIYNNLNSFLNGFSRGNPEREDQARTELLKRWLDSIAFESLSELENAYEADASTLIRIIVDVSDDNFRRFVLYQGIRGFVDRFLHEGILPIALMVELLIHLQSSGSSQNFLESLLQRILESAISNFDLQRYAAYVESRSWQSIDSSIRKDRGEGEKGTRSTRAGPIKAFYELVCAHDQGTPSRLLGKIQPQASKLTKAQLKNFLMPLLEELITIVDISSSESQECFQSLLTIYIIRTVGKEPKKPSDWARPEEVLSKCYMKCDCYAKMNKFLMDSTAKTHRISCKEIWNLRYNYHWFEYFQVESVDTTPFAVAKTLKWWEQQHQEWESCASIALEALRKLPQAKLKECLAHQYDEIMDLRIVKADDGSTRPESTSKVRHRYQTRSTVPQKRSRKDL